MKLLLYLMKLWECWAEQKCRNETTTAWIWNRFPFIFSMSVRRSFLCTSFPFVCFSLPSIYLFSFFFFIFSIFSSLLRPSNIRDCCCCCVLRCCKAVLRTNNNKDKSLRFSLGFFIGCIGKSHNFKRWIVEKNKFNKSFHWDSSSFSLAWLRSQSKKFHLFPRVMWESCFCAAHGANVTAAWDSFASYI